MLLHLRSHLLNIIGPGEFKLGPSEDPLSVPADTKYDICNYYRFHIGSFLNVTFSACDTCPLSPVPLLKVSVLGGFELSFGQYRCLGPGLGEVLVPATGEETSPGHSRSWPLKQTLSRSRSR